MYWPGAVSTNFAGLPRTQRLISSAPLPVHFWAGLNSRSASLKWNSVALSYASGMAWAPSWTIVVSANGEFS